MSSCPNPHEEHERVLLGHGAGGRLTAELLESLLLPAVGGFPAGPPEGPLEDAAPLPGRPELVMSTDGFVVHPLFFPGGDIGSLAVHGTVNDLAVMGARPLALSVALVIEEGLPLSELRSVAGSLGKAAREAEVPVVTGDTKVVGRGAADKIFITTTGIGTRIPGLAPSAARARPGDAVLLSGPIGLHGTAVLSTREGLGFEADIVSDSRPLHRLVEALAPVGARLHTLRDPTRGGLAATLNEIARDSGVAVEIDESALPVPGPVASACDLLGLDPLHVANEGCMVAFVAPSAAEAALAAMRSRAEGTGAVRIGEATAGPAGRVLMRTLVGARRVVDMPIGEQLPRIC
ncbi:MULTISPECIES: hydrogenase expression/formation protein HypE [Streptomyces]|uniref:Hydrogenase expression/formation protein HypE n=2 Tax=Streptomyces TaxID=1883 RepID=A0A3M8EXE3_9ACTN|nr:MULTISPECIES: hydrogenase expression/formation protein HypE [Streptomyces]KNE81703.1 hydrogenase [Streptomyces fradiae]OFA50021.1 hydrogenase expression/formation protein HypE [Streptomyces fradiae]PQM23539.1 hydrogenase expression/formation protein HypE [Streptomyces xinghaiensis]RKM92205.1 hydrogenase expression/formation protein HypE [Streptomyces xinghaiensis]RNC70176.1 hydrogenase expression/formation protein HypE [Streptomyces xinghaiensis]